MIRIAIVEDEKSAADELSEMLSRYAAANLGGGTHFFDIVRFDNAVSFLANYRPVYDIIFMDKEMPDINGFDASVKLRSIDPDVILIFVTNLSQFAVRGYEVDALDFVVKPLKYGVLDLKLRRALSRLERARDAETEIQFNDSVVKVKLSEIIYVEILAHKIMYHTTRGDFKAYGTLKKVEEKLDASRFARCNSCYLVNLAHVKGINGYSVDLGGTELAISHAKRKEFVQAVNNYMGR